MRFDRQSSPRIAIVGAVQAAREELTHQLKEAGFESVIGLDILNSRFERTGTPDIAMFLPRTPQQPRNELAKKLRKSRPLVKIVMLYDDTIAGTETADAVISANCGIEDLVRVLNYLTKKLAEDESKRA